MDRFHFLKKSIENANKIQINLSIDHTYEFNMYEFGERGQFLSSGLIREVAFGLAISIQNHVKYTCCIVSPEPGGHLWGSMVALLLNCPLVIIRMHPSCQNGETDILIENGYSKRKYYFPRMDNIKRIVIVDDVISTGSTLLSISEHIKKSNISIEHIQAIHAKQTIDDLQSKIGTKIATLTQSYKV